MANGNTSAGALTFTFSTQNLRVVLRDGDPWFVAADVCAALGITRTSDGLERLDDDEKGAGSVRTPGGPQQMAIVNESGLYSLVLGSRKPEAKAFKRWVTHEVLPAVRKTGRYQHLAAEPVVPPAKLGEIGEWVMRQHAQHAARYLYRNRQGINEALRAGIEARFGVPARDLPVSLLPELLDALEGFGQDCYRIWRVGLELEGLLLSQWSGNPGELPAAVRHHMQRVSVPCGPETVLTKIRTDLQAMLPHLAAALERLAIEGSKKP